MAFHFGRESQVLMFKLSGTFPKEGEGYSDSAPSSNVWDFPPNQAILRHQLEFVPQIQLNSDTIYLELASDSTGRGLSPTRLSPLQMPIPRHPGCFLPF